MSDYTKAMVEVEGVIRHRTDNAVLFYDGRVEAWLPESQIANEEHDSVTGSVFFEIPEWLAEAEGLI
jgi:hypothetical protein